MKKVFRTLLILAILCVSGCDFLRRVAGRPTSTELERKAEKLEAVRAGKEKAAMQDSLKAVTAGKIEDALRELALMQVKVSSESRFGSPVRPLQNKYNVIAGVFRKSASAAKIVEAARKKGYNAFLIAFTGGVNAVCLAGADSPEGFPEMINGAKKDGLCPSDGWIYVRQD